MEDSSSAGEAAKGNREDPPAITRILDKLLDNATTHFRPERPSGYRPTATERRRPLAVQDVGPGISPVDRSIFQRCKSLERPTASPGGGLGGLACILQRLTHANRCKL